MNLEDQKTHRAELRLLFQFFIVLICLTQLTYLIPAAADYRPWVFGEPIPIVRLFTQRQSAVVEMEPGQLTVVEAGYAPEGEAPPPKDVTLELEVPAPPAEEPGPNGVAQPIAAEPPEAPRSRKITLPRREPAQPTLLEAPPGSLDAWFTALARAEAGHPGVIARALHWGDSIIASDGFPGAIRTRLHDRFGYGGPGFLAVHVDPRWQLRHDVTRSAKGAWNTFNITQGGANGPYYGLAGTVSTAEAESSVFMGGKKVEGERPLLHVFDLYYQTQPGGGGVRMKPRKAPGFASGTGGRQSDRFKRLEVPQGAQSVVVSTPGNGPVAIYGVAMETKGPGVTWENFGVAGSSEASLMRQGRKHLARQVARRDPHLIVMQMGGNALSYPSLAQEDGGGYTKNLHKAMERIRAGAPEASCLIISPFDKATRKKGRIVPKPNLPRMIELQRGVAKELGCAFWDGRNAMGGPGSVSKWYNRKPRLVVSDLNHLTRAGAQVMGDTFADAMLGAYDLWKSDHPEAGKLPTEAAPEDEDAPVESPQPGSEAGQGAEAAP